MLSVRAILQRVGSSSEVDDRLGHRLGVHIGRILCGHVPVCRQQLLHLTCKTRRIRPVEDGDQHPLICGLGITLGGLRRRGGGRAAVGTGGAGRGGAPAPAGGATIVPLANPFARTATPATTSATMITIRAVPRFTRAILPQASAVAGRRQRDPEPTGRSPLATTRVADATEPANEHGVVRKRLRPIDGAVHQLVVSRGGEPEALADGALLRDSKLPGLALEIQKIAVTLIERRALLRLPLGGRQAHVCEANNHRPLFKHPRVTSRS